MRAAFEILGCGFSETEIPRDDVDFVIELLWLMDSKRPIEHPIKSYSVPLPATLSSVR